MEAPREDDFITNSDESKVVPDENPEPLEGIKTDEPETKTDQAEEEEQDSSKTGKDA